MGLPGVEEAAERIRAAREASEARQNEPKKEYPQRRKLVIGDGEEVRVRFLVGDNEEDRKADWKFIWVHRGVVKTARNGNTYYSDVPCLDQEGKGKVDCPGCELYEQTADDENPKARRSQMFYLSVIWRDAPVYKRDENNQVVRENDQPVVERNEDVVAWWSKGFNVAKTLNKLDARYKGLGNRDYTIHREGTKFDTNFDIGPATDDDGELVKKSALTKADKELAKNKPDLNELIQPPKAEHFFLSAGAAAQQEEGEGDEEKPKSGSRNPFTEDE